MTWLWFRCTGYAVSHYLNSIRSPPLPLTNWAHFLCVRLLSDYPFLLSRTVIIVNSRNDSWPKGAHNEVQRMNKSEFRITHFILDVYLMNDLSAIQLRCDCAFKWFSCFFPAAVCHISIISFSFIHFPNLRPSSVCCRSLAKYLFICRRFVVLLIIWLQIEKKIIIIIKL